MFAIQIAVDYKKQHSHSNLISMQNMWILISDVTGDA